MEMFHLRIFEYRNAYASEKDVRWNQPTHKRYDQCLVIWKFSSCTSSPAGFLTHRSSHKTAFPKLSRQFIQLSFFLSDRTFAHGLVFPAHSDEIVQVFHLFPFYLLSACSHELFHSGSSTGCLFDCYWKYFTILVIIMQESNLKTETDAGHFRLLFSQSVNRNHFHKNIRKTGVESS